MFAPERSYVINLDRRSDRLVQFYNTFPACLESPERFAAVDGSLAPFTVPHRAAWGCLQSHLAIFRKCIEEGVESVLIFEDDALPYDDTCARWGSWVQTVPDDWQFVYLGAAPTHARKPLKISDTIYMPRTMRATHSYAVRQPMLQDIYERITQCGWNNHIDHWYEAYFGTDGRPGYYCPDRWFFKQAGGFSDISGSHWGQPLSWEHPCNIKNAKQETKRQPCDQDATGRCRRKRCGRINAAECAVGTGVQLIVNDS